MARCTSFEKGPGTKRKGTTSANPSFTCNATLLSDEGVQCHGATSSTYSRRGHVFVVAVNHHRRHFPGVVVAWKGCSHGVQMHGQFLGYADDNCSHWNALQAQRAVHKWDHTNPKAKHCALPSLRPAQSNHVASVERQHRGLA